MEDIKSVNDLETQLASHSVPWDQIAPDLISNWLNIFSKAHGCSKDLLLVSMLAATSGIVGKLTHIEVFSSLKENANLFLIGLAPSGAGKTPSCNYGCVYPIVNFLEDRIPGKQFMIDETSTSALFKLLSSGDAEVPIVCIDEANAFFAKLLCSGRSSSGQSLSMERLCKLYDGEYWYSLKGNQAKRAGTQSARISLCAYMTPRRFLQEIWPKIVSFKNGLPDRILIVYQKRGKTNYHQMELANEQLKTLPLKSLDGVYEAIYVEHKAGKTYVLSTHAKETFLAFTRESDEQAPQPSASSKSTECDAKSSKNILRLALNLHILWHRMLRMLHLSAEPTPDIVSLGTLNMAIALHSSLATFSGIAEKSVDLLSGTNIKMGTNDEDIKRKIIQLPQCFVTARKINNSFSSTKRPRPAQTQECMESLEESNLGIMKKINKSIVFYKCLPTEVIGNEKLMELGISLDNYREAFHSDDDNMTQSLKRLLINNHPFRETYDTYIENENRTENENDGIEIDGNENNENENDGSEIDGGENNVNENDGSEIDGGENNVNLNDGSEIDGSENNGVEIGGNENNENLIDGGDNGGNGVRVDEWE